MASNTYKTYYDFFIPENIAAYEERPFIEIKF